MKENSEVLITDLIERSRQNLNIAEELKKHNDKALNWKTDENSWSALECIEHLNLYGDFYLPEISNRINNSKTIAVNQFKSGILGNYFAIGMLPKEKLNKMKTFKDKNPIGSKLDKSAIDRFIHQQTTLLELLDKARSVNLNKTKTSISISKFIKLKLGDTFRVVIYHNQRHLVQAEKALAQFSA